MCTMMMMMMKCNVLYTTLCASGFVRIPLGSLSKALFAEVFSLPSGLISLRSPNDVGGGMWGGWLRVIFSWSPYEEDVKDVD